MSAPQQTVYFYNPSTITSLQSSVSQLQSQVGSTSGSITTNNLTATGSVTLTNATVLGNMTVGNSNILSMQDQIYNLQTAVAPQVASAGAMNTQSFYGMNTIPNQNYRSAVDDYSSKHVYDQGGMSSDNLQYLQLDSNASVPTSLHNPISPCTYQNGTGVYVLGASTVALYFTGSATSTNRNRLTRREQWNLLQDINQITGAYGAWASGYTGFVSAWASGLGQTSDIWTQTLGVYNESTAITAQADTSVHTWGNYASFWRYDTTTKQVIARSVPDMTKELWGASSNNWKIATNVMSFVTALGNDLFVAPIINPSTYGLIVFDINLNPVTVMQASAFAGPLSGVPGIDPLNFNVQADTYKAFGLQTDQIRGAIVKKWGFSQLGTDTFRDLSNGQNINVFSGNTGSQATFIYVSSSSQASYNGNDLVENMGKLGVVSPLSTAKWDNSCGKLTAWALCTGAGVGPVNATGTTASSNGMRLVPVAQYLAAPDNYVAGDILQLDSYTIDPLTGQYAPLYIEYPVVDIRDEVVYATGAFRSNTGTWFASEGFKQTTFQTGSSTTGGIAGIQTFAISICCMTGADTVTAYIPDGYKTTTLSFPRNKRHWEDLYGQYYYQYTDSTGTYFQQNRLMDNIIQLTDINVKFYTSPTVQYLDTNTNVMYIQQVDGTYKDGSSAVDPSPNASLRQIILNNGFAIRHCFSSYDLLNAPTGSGNINNGTFTNPLNPQIVPVTSVTAGRCPQGVFADFDMPEGTLLDINNVYASEPFSLTFQDWTNFTGAVSFGTTAQTTAVRYNENYASTGLYNANMIKDIFNFAQLGLSSNVINVRLAGEAYTGAGNGKSGFVPAGSVVFEVKGEVFNGQITKKRLLQSAAGNLVLTEFEAKQLNYSGGGLYGNTSLWQDQNGESHIFIGNSNGNYIPSSEMWEITNYAARQLIADKQAGILPCSAATLRILGLDDIQINPGPTLRSSFSKINSSIYNSNGKFILDCSVLGLITFKAAVINMARGLAASGPNTVMGINQVSGVETLINCDKISGALYNNMWYRNAYNEIAILTGQQFIEAWDLVQHIFSYYPRFLSNRRRRFMHNVTCMVNAKTLAVEQVVRGYTNYSSLHSNIGRAPQRVSHSMGDFSGWNEDEVEGIVTSGSLLMATKSKTAIKVWKINDCLTRLTTLKSYTGPSGLNRPNFSITYDGSLGQQINIVGTGASYTYGNVSELTTSFSTVANLNGSVCYLGKQGGKDIFVHGNLAQIANNGHTIYFSPNLYKVENTKYNVFLPHKKGAYTKLSDDGKVISFLQKGAAAGGAFNPTMSAIQSPLVIKDVCAFTMSDDGTSIKYPWKTFIAAPSHPELYLSTGAGSITNLSGLSLSRAAQDYDRSWAVLNGSTAFVVNDLVIQVLGSTTWIMRADTGEIVYQGFGHDLDWDESYLPEKTTAAGIMSGQDEHYLGAPTYMNGSLYFTSGQVGRGQKAVYGPVGRTLHRLNIKYNTPQTVQLTSLLVATGSVGASNNQTVVFTPQDAIAQNSNQWCLLTTFKTTDYYNTRKPEYANIDLDYDALYLSGVSAIAIYDPSNTFLGMYQTPSLDISTRFVNGGSWYARTGISLKNLLASGVVKFMYAGQIPYKCRAQSPFIVSEDQIQEAVIVRRQKRLLQEYLRAKNGSTLPYPDNGCYVENNLPFINTVKFKQYWNWATPTNPATAVIYNQSLGYTDVGTGRPLSTPL